MKPADGGGWRDVHKCDDAGKLLRCLRLLARPVHDGAGSDRIHRILSPLRPGPVARAHHAVRPGAPHHERYVRDAPPIDPHLEARMRRDGIALCEALGYDMNTVEFAVRGGVPYAIDFMNPAPDADRNSVGAENFDWVVDTMAEVLIDRVRRPQPFETTGLWPRPSRATARLPCRFISKPAVPSGTRPSFTLGIEEEFQVIDPETSRIALASAGDVRTGRARLARTDRSAKCTSPSSKSEPTFARTSQRSPSRSHAAAQRDHRLARASTACASPPPGPTHFTHWSSVPITETSATPARLRPAAGSPRELDLRIARSRRNRGQRYPHRTS